jgi:hypothetical protein
MDEATVVVNKFVESDPEQARWHARICEDFDGTQVSVIATPWDQALANRVPLDLGAVAGTTLDAKLVMAEQVLRGVDRADRRRRGLPEPEPEDQGLPAPEPEDPRLPAPETEDSRLPGREAEDQGLPKRETEDPGSNPWSGAWPPHRSSPPAAPASGPDDEAAEADTADVPVVTAGPQPDGVEDPPDSPDAGPDPPRTWILPAQPKPGSPGTMPG